MNKIFKLFYIFFKIGLFTFGGGYAMIAQIKEVIVDKNEWISEEEFFQIVAISESTPGPIAINMATYIGYKKASVLGSIFATLGVVLPSFILIFIISLFLDKFMTNEYVKYAFLGINAAVSFIIIKTGINLFIKMKKNVISIISFLLVFSLLIIFEILCISLSSIIYIVIGGVVGIIYYAFIVKEAGDSKC